jgi:uncharacterized protein (TIGR03437 family)
MRYFIWLAILDACAFAQITPPGPGFIPFAGGKAGGDGPAIFAALGYVQSIAFDAQGNLYIADASAFLVRKVSTSGVITTVAGNGAYGFSGDGGLATSAQIGSPNGLAVDAGGNLYIADVNGRIRRVSTSGIITTFAGNGDLQTLWPGQIAIDSQGNLYVASQDQSNVRKIDPHGVITPFAAVTAFGVAVDAKGNVLIDGAGSVEKVTPDGKISSFTGLGGFLGGSLAVGPDGKVALADYATNRIIQFTADGTAMRVIAGTGATGFSEGCGTAGEPLKKIATNAQFNEPQAVAVDASGAVYVADSGNQRVRKITPDGLIATVAGPGPGASGDGGPASEAGLFYSKAITVDSGGAIYIADTGNNRVRKIGTDGVIHTIAGDGPTSVDDPACFAPSDAFLSEPSGVAVDAKGNVFVADTNNNRIRKIALDGAAATIAGTGKPGYSGDGGPAAAAMLTNPSSLAVDAAGDLFISDTGNSVVREVTPDGKIKTAIPGISGGLVFDAAGNFYYGGSLYVYRMALNGDVQVVAGTGDYESSIVPGSPFIGAGDIGFAGAVAISPDGTLAVADTSASRVQRVSANCGVDDPAMLDPGGVVYDRQGNLYVTSGFGTVVWQLPAGAVPPAQGPTPTLGFYGTYNAASFELIPPAVGEPPGPSFREPIAPGEILLLHGICMGPASRVFGHFDSSGRLSRKLAQTEVTFDGVAAPLLFVENSQIELIAPYELAGKNVTTMTVSNGGHSSSTPVNVAGASAGLFTVDGEAAAANSDGTLNSPTNPAARGEVIALYATGLGQTNPPGVDGVPVNGLAKAIESVVVQIGGVNAQVLFAGDAPGFVGLSQINVKVPEGLTPGLYLPVSMIVAGNISSQIVTISIK